MDEKSRLPYIWERYSVIISLFLSFIGGVLYYQGIIGNLRSILSDVIAFSSITIGVNGVFITLIISIKLTPAFERLKKLLPNFEKRLFKLLRNQVMFGLIVVTLSIIIKFLPHSPSEIYSGIGFTIWSFFFIKMSIGAFFTMDLITNLILGNAEDPRVRTRE